MVNAVLWILFIILLILIVSPIDFLPGPVDDALYALFDVVIVAVLHERSKRKKARETESKSETELEPSKPELIESND
jgi:hypothetical protein